MTVRYEQDTTVLVETYRDGNVCHMSYGLVVQDMPERGGCLVRLDDVGEGPRGLCGSTYAEIMPTKARR